MNFEKPNFSYKLDLPYKHLLARDVSNPSEGARVIYEVDKSQTNKLQAYAILGEIFRELDEMQIAFSECSPLIKGLEQVDAWKCVAKNNRKREERDLTIEVSLLRERM